MGEPINSSAYHNNDDTGLWKTKDEYHKISEMDNDFLETAFYHCLKKIGDHSERVKKAMASLSKFEEKSREIYQEMQKRGIADRVDDTPSDALRKALGNKINLTNGKEAS